VHITMTVTTHTRQRAAVLDDRDGDRAFLADSPDVLRAPIGIGHEAHPLPRRDTHKDRSAMDEALDGRS